MNKNEQELQIIGQGTYGCVFRPNIECSKKDRTDPDFLSKIQQKDRTMINEINIGKKLPKSPRFAGILKTCPVTVGKIGKDGVSKCKMIQNKQSVNLVSNKIQYAGKDTISKYLQNILSSNKSSEKQSEDYIKAIINTHVFLLQSLVVLNTSNVLHLDIKYNNIMIRDNKPVVIDFGLSFEKDKLNIDKYKTKSSLQPFGIAVDYYIPWCFEVILLSHVSRYMSVVDKDGNIKILIDKEKEGTVLNSKEEEILIRILNKYIENNNVISMSIFTAQEKASFKEKMLLWIKELKGKTWRDIWNKIISSSNTWDNYGLAVMFLIELDLSGLLQITDSQTEGFLRAYVNEIKQTILSTPNERKLPEDTNKSLTAIFSRIKKIEHRDRVAKFSLLLKDKGNREKMIRNRVIAETDSVQKTELLKKQMLKKN